MRMTSYDKIPPLGFDPWPKSHSSFSFFLFFFALPDDELSV